MEWLFQMGTGKNDRKKALYIKGKDQNKVNVQIPEQIIVVYH